MESRPIFTAWPVPFCSVWSMKPMPAPATDWRTWPAWCPTTAKMRSGGARANAVSRTCWRKVFPPALCSTLALRLFMRVPSPAARITMVTGLCITTILLCVLAAAAFLGQGDHYGGSGGGVVADLVGVAGEVAGHDLQPHLHEGVDIVLHGEGGLPGVALLEGAGDEADVDHGVVEELAAGVAVEHAHVIAGAEFIGFAGLPHEVDEVALEGGRGTDGGGDAVHQQIGDDAGEQRTGAEGDQVGLGDGGEGGGHGADFARPQANGLDAMLAAADAGFADDDGAVGEGGFQRDVGGGAGVDAAGDFEDFRGGRDGVGEIAQDLGEGHEEEVAEAVALEPAAGWEAVLEEAGQQGRVFAEGEHAGER